MDKRNGSSKLEDMERLLVDIALVLRAAPLCERLVVFDTARLRPDEATSLKVGLSATASEIDTAEFLSLRECLSLTAQKSAGALKPVILMDSPAGTLWELQPLMQKWAKAKPTPITNLEVKKGEPFHLWFNRIVSPRLDPQGGSVEPVAPAQQLRSLRASISQHLDPSWLEPAYMAQWNLDNPTLGFCSIAAEAAFFELGGSPAGWKGMVQRESPTQTHWWIEHVSGLRFDPTDSQYRQENAVPPYERGLTGRACAFMGMRQDPESRWGFGRKPGLRAAALLNKLRPEGSSWPPLAPPPLSRPRRSHP